MILTAYQTLMKPKCPICGATKDFAGEVICLPGKSTVNKVAYRRCRSCGSDGAFQP